MPALKSSLHQLHSIPVLDRALVDILQTDYSAIEIRHSYRYNGCMKRRWALAALLFPLFGAPSSDYLSCKQKLELIAGETLRSGTRVTLTARELNAYIAGQVPEYAPQ